MFDRGSEASKCLSSYSMSVAERSRKQLFDSDAILCVGASQCIGAQKMSIYHLIRGVPKFSPSSTKLSHCPLSLIGAEVACCEAL